MTCITTEQLLTLAQNHFSAHETEPLRAHLDAGCGDCRKRFDELRATLAAATGHHLVKPPAWLTHQAMSLFAWHKRNPGRSHPERIPAFLLVDSYAEGALPGFRNTGLMSRQMLYRAKHYSINLSIHAIERPASVDVMGQAMPLGADIRSLGKAGVELLHESELAGTTTSNEFGAFILTGIPEGVYDLRITAKDAELDIIGLSAIVRPR
jgi:hypothetical protein